MLLALLPRGAFQRSLTVLVRYRSPASVFSLGWSAPPDSATTIKVAYSSDDPCRWSPPARRVQRRAPEDVILKGRGAGHHQGSPLPQVPIGDSEEA